MIGDVNTYDGEVLETRWWRFVQWGIRAEQKKTPCGIVDCDHARHRPYRYFLLKLPVWWYAKDRYNGAISVSQSGRCTYRRRWERLVILWTDFPGLRFHWERTELTF